MLEPVESGSRMYLTVYSRSTSVMLLEARGLNAAKFGTYSRQRRVILDHLCQLLLTAVVSAILKINCWISTKYMEEASGRSLLKPSSMQVCKFWAVLSRPLPFCFFCIQIIWIKAVYVTLIKEVNVSFVIYFRIQMWQCLNFELSTCNSLGSVSDCIYHDVSPCTLGFACQFNIPAIYFSLFDTSMCSVISYCHILCRQFRLHTYHTCRNSHCKDGYRYLKPDSVITYWSGLLGFSIDCVPLWE